MRCSICIGTKNHSQLLDRALFSIFQQRPTFDFEVVVADDGSTDDTRKTLRMYPKVKTVFLPPTTGHTSGRSRNAAMRASRGDLLIHQSDEVIHVRDDSIERLVSDFVPGTITIATVYNYCVETGLVGPQYTPRYDGGKLQEIFFLGVSLREDVYRIGGNDPDFDSVKGGEDLWLIDCLVQGLGRKIVHSPVLGLHQDHPRNGDNTTGWYKLLEKRKTKQYCSSTGPWEYKP
jgi:glycosyltransferase involved in cell wall biosynthesis